MHIAILVATEAQPTEVILEEALAPFGKSSVPSPRYDWYALGGRFSGLLMPHDIIGALTGGLEYPDDELPLLPNHRHTPGPGVDALQIKNLQSFLNVPRIIVIDGQLHELELRNIKLRSGLLVPFYLGDFDPSVPVFSHEKVSNDWDEPLDEILDRIPDDYWISIVDCRLSRAARRGRRVLTGD